MKGWQARDRDRSPGGAGSGVSATPVCIVRASTAVISIATRPVIRITVEQSLAVVSVLTGSPRV